MVSTYRPAGIFCNSYKYSAIEVGEAKQSDEVLMLVEGGAAGSAILEANAINYFHRKLSALANIHDICCIASPFRKKVRVKTGKRFVVINMDNVPAIVVRTYAIQGKAPVYVDVGLSWAGFQVIFFN